MKKSGTEEKLFFRYQKINDHTKDNLKNHVLYFNDPENFNDPFDSKVDVIYRGSKEDWINFYLRYDTNPLNIDKLIKNKTLKIKGTELLFDKTKNTGDFTAKNYYRVCCFSNEKLNILMWSHYAENHQGICLCFKTHTIENGHFLILDSKQHVLYPVKYIEQKPKQVNLLYEGNYEELMDFFTHKYQDWEYENEYRTLINKSEFEDDYTKEFRKEDLEGVIFGLNAKPDKMKEIYEIINTHYLQKGVKVNFYRTQKTQRYFSLRVKKIDSISKYLEKIS